MVVSWTTSGMNYYAKLEGTPVRDYFHLILSGWVHFLPRSLRWEDARTSVIRMFKVGRHTLKSALSAGRLYKAMEGGSYCSSSDCSCLATKSILSLTLESTSSLEFQCLLKTNWGIQPCELSMSGFSDFLFTFHHCWISWTVVCDSNKPPLCIY